MITSECFLLYRVYHVADVRFRIGTTVASTLVLLSCGTNFNTIGILVPLTAEDETIEETKLRAGIGGMATRVWLLQGRAHCSYTFRLGPFGRRIGNHSAG